MISVSDFCNSLLNIGINFFTGVPDSLLKDFCTYISDNTDKYQNIITANEGNAIGVAAGHYLVTSNPCLVYMQNSGLGNAINPLASLTDRLVYNIPLLLLIGWRGEPGQKDEPQHSKQGKITLALLETMGIPFSVLPDNQIEMDRMVRKVSKYVREEKNPFAIVVRKGTFYPLNKKDQNEDKNNYFEMTREDAIKIIVKELNKNDIIVSTTGKISRELFEYREKLGHTHSGDFLTIGSMGHSSQIALGIALERAERCVICIDGDGSFLMHMGGIAVIADQNLANFKHIILNNGAHDSVGGQPTVAFNMDIPSIAIASGYKHAFSVNTKIELTKKIKEVLSLKGTVMLEVKTKKGARSNLGRPTISPIQNKKDFMKYLNDLF